MMRRSLLALLAILPAMGVSCTPSDSVEEHAALGSPYGDVTPDAVRAHTDTGSRTTEMTRDVTLQPGALAGVYAAPVNGWEGPDGRPFEVALRTEHPATALARRFGTITLRTALRVRAPDLGQYPCTSCHLGQATRMTDARASGAHENIKTAHPVQTGGACATCHSAANVEQLALRNGERVTLDHTYRLCAQCHFAQAKAWAGGGHGKRLDGWQGRRVVLGCADCHDPHRPALEPRIPFRAPNLERPRPQWP